MSQRPPPVVTRGFSGAVYVNAEWCCELLTLSGARKSACPTRVFRGFPPLLFPGAQHLGSDSSFCFVVPDLGLQALKQVEDLNASLTGFSTDINKAKADIATLTVQ